MNDPSPLSHLPPGDADFIQEVILFTRQQLETYGELVPLLIVRDDRARALDFYAMPFSDDREKRVMFLTTRTIVKNKYPHRSISVFISEAWTLPEEFVTAHREQHRETPLPSEHSARIEIVNFTVETPTTVTGAFAEIIWRNGVRTFNEVQWRPLASAETAVQVGGDAIGFVYQGPKAKSILP
jgi:hypothetical protein